MTDSPHNETHERILNAADALFSQRGYAAVKLRDIAADVGMRHASLYYYAPEGKEQLFVEVMERNLRQHRAGILHALANAQPDLPAQLRAVAHWLLTQPPLDLNRMANVDLHAISTKYWDRLTGLALALHEPLVDAIAAAHVRGEIQFTNHRLAALAFVTLIEGVHAVPEAYRAEPIAATVDAVIAMLLDGWRNSGT